MFAKPITEIVFNKEKWLYSLTIEWGITNNFTPDALKQLLENRVSYKEYVDKDIETIKKALG